ncbi:MAG TPA: polyribonucleotide nucleotidyltransferase, partial [Hyphomonadaceae bacterium]|nr:polyribonucleotide nucleotidyltransferase [Hyphomonadaceae bacterium]
ESEAKELSEDIMLGAVMAGHKAIQEVIDLIIDLGERAAKEPWDYEPEDRSAELKQVQDLVGADLSAAYKIKD